MDPRNFLTEKGIFQFETLAFNSQYQNAVGVESILYNTPLYNKNYSFINDSGATVTKSYSESFMDAAVYSGVSPYHLASRSKQEVVTGVTTLSDSVSGTFSGYQGFYNFFNIGAYHSTAAGGAIANALKYAKNGTTSSSLNTQYLIPWDNPYDAIVGGSYIIGSTYIKRGQDTIYLQKFNMTAASTFSHQYMANIEAPNAEAAKTYAAYSNMSTMPLVFSVPVYLNMPETVSQVPVKAYNPNNWLKTLAVDGYSLSPTFDLKADQQYSLIVPNSTASIKVSASAVSTKATVQGTGNIILNTGNNIVTITVTAENGNTRNYIINVFREAAATP
jgi:beta-N-acetylglucosaminidase